jgi:hypothetical protein
MMKSLIIASMLAFATLGAVSVPANAETVIIRNDQYGRHWDRRDHWRDQRDWRHHRDWRRWHHRRDCRVRTVKRWHHHRLVIRKIRICD